jgi:hypothetical protein
MLLEIKKSDSLRKSKTPFKLTNPKSIDDS